MVRGGSGSKYSRTAFNNGLRKGLRRRRSESQAVRHLGKSLIIHLGPQQSVAPQQQQVNLVRP